jgi:hypothetical protein
VAYQFIFLVKIINHTTFGFWDCEHGGLGIVLMSSVMVLNCVAVFLIKYVILREFVHEYTGPKFKLCSKWEVFML